MDSFNILSPESMLHLIGGDRERTVTYVDTDGDGDPDQKVVEVRVNGRLKRQKIKQL